MAFGGSKEDDEWKKFQQNPESLKKYLSARKPSDPSWNKKNASWIFVYNPSAARRSTSMIDWANAMRLWEELQSSQVTITAEQVKEIAIKSNVTVGKWMIFKQRSIVDETWQKITEATVAGKLGCSAKVSTVLQSDAGSKYKRHLICVYTENYTDTDDVMRVEKQLRSLGIGGLLNYKPDVYTNFNIYANNPYKIKASVYTTKEPTA